MFPSDEWGGEPEGVGGNGVLVSGILRYEGENMKSKALCDSYYLTSTLVPFLYSSVILFDPVTVAVLEEEVVVVIWLDCVRCTFYFVL